MTIHPDKQQLELYVVGGLDPVKVTEIERHFASCADCLAEVIEQAKLEATLCELGAVVVPCPGCHRVGRETRCNHCGAARVAGGFRIEKVMVQGSHGRMYLARGDEGQKIALKELVFVHAPDASAVGAFEREAAFLRALDHPAIPRFVASFQEGEGIDTRLYLAQEYIDGPSLASKLADHFFTEDEIADIAIRVLEVLAYLQALSPMVSHRDVKPANLIRRADGSIALVDFGAAFEAGQGTATTAVGTFGYMPVEQLAGIVDATTDVYALGSSLLHLLTRREPWKFIDDVASVRVNVSAPVLRVLHKMVARRQRDRFASAADALAAWRRVRERPARRRAFPVVAAAALACAAVIGAGGTYAAMKLSGDPPAAAEEREPRVMQWSIEPVPPVPPIPPVAAFDDDDDDDDDHDFDFDFDFDFEPPDVDVDVDVDLDHGSIDTGIPACDRLFNAILTCDKLPRSAHRGVRRGARGLRRAMDSVPDLVRPKADEACNESLKSVQTSLESIGCKVDGKD